MAWLLTLILGLSLLLQPVTLLGLNSTQPLSNNNLSVQAIDNHQKTSPTSHHTSWIVEKVDNRLSKDFFVPLLPNFSIKEGSGEGSGLEQSLEDLMPSTGPLEMDMFIPDRTEKQDFEMQDFAAHPALPIPQKLTQHNDDDDQDIILENDDSAPDQAMSTIAAQLTMHAHINNNERMNTDQPLLTTTKPITVTNTKINFQDNIHLETFPTDVAVHSKEDMKISQDTKYVASTQSLISITKLDKSGHNGTLVTQSGLIQGSLDNFMVGEERSVTNHPPVTTSTLQDEISGKARHEETSSDLPVGSSSTASSVLQTRNKDNEKPKWFRSLFGPFRESDLSGVVGTCILGPCVISTGGNVTQLQWEDLKRTLTFAWELHVFGSAVLNLLVVVAATFGVISGANMRHPFCEVFSLANILLLSAGLLRFLQLIVDPYGTRNILPRPALTALYNLPVPLLLWAQATLALLALREETTPQQISVTGGLAALHCTSLLLADLLSKTLSPALPLMLQTLTICWGLPLCLGIFFQSLKQLCSSHRTSLPRWSAPKRLENSVRRVLLLCTLLGVLSCTLQTYSFLWLYGLLGDWRRFGWGWWIGQLSARLLELAWSFSLLLLGSRVFWRPQGSKQTTKRTRKGKPAPVSCWDKLLDRLPMGPWRRPDRKWAELLPNNWKGHRQCHENISQSVIRNHSTPATSIMTMHDNAGVIGGGVLYSSSYDHHASPLWGSGVEWQEHECFLSLIEFDLHPPSPINLHHSIDSALHHAHLLGVGTLFTPSAPSWTQNEGSGRPSPVESPTTPTNKAYRWALETGSSPNSPQHLGTAVQQAQVSFIEPLASLTPGTIRKVWEKDTAIPRFSLFDDCTSIASGDDITSF